MGNTAPTSTPNFHANSADRHALYLATYVLFPAPSAGRSAPCSGAPGAREHIENAGRGCQSATLRTTCPGGGLISIFWSQGAARDGRHRSHRIGNSRGARRLLRHQAIEEEGPMGHRIVEHLLSALRHAYARDP